MNDTCAGCHNTLGAGHHPRRKWCSERCRKASYGQPCVDCGTRTVHGAESARVPEPRCATCSAAHRRIWTPDRILDRIKAWEAEHGTAPAVADWCPYIARPDEQRAARFKQGGWPSKTTVIDEFGSWNAAIAAAGLTPRSPGHSIAQVQEAA